MRTLILTVVALSGVAIGSARLQAAGDVLVVDGVEYANWSLVKEYPQSVFIQHSSGRTFVDKAKLSAADMEAMGLSSGTPQSEPAPTPPPAIEEPAEDPPPASAPAANPNKKTYSKDELTNAYYSARNAIKGVLTAPKTAKFSNPVTDPRTGAEPDDAGRIVCRGTVESQNAFGVPLTQSWVVWLMPEGETQWRTVYAVLDGNVLLDTRDQHQTQQTRSARSFLGMTREQMLKELGEPAKITEGGHPDDGTFNLYSYGGAKGGETFFTIWDSDGKISSGMYKGTSFSE